VHHSADAKACAKQVEVYGRLNRTLVIIDIKSTPDISTLKCDIDQSMQLTLLGLNQAECAQQDGRT
jgi:hypothetical protein